MFPPTREKSSGYLLVGIGPQARVPLFVVVIAWPAIARIYALFSVLFIVAFVGLIWLLTRIRIF